MKASLPVLIQRFDRAFSEFIYDGIKTGIKGAGTGTFQNGKRAAIIAAGTADTAGIQQNNFIHAGEAGDVGMAKERRLRPRVSGGGGYGCAAFPHAIAVTVGQKEFAAGYFQYQTAGNGRIVIPITPNGIPGEGKTCLRGRRPQILKTISQKNRRVTGKTGIAYPFKDRYQRGNVAMRIGNNQNGRVFQFQSLAGSYVSVIPSAIQVMITASRLLIADAMSIFEATKLETSAPAMLYMRIPSVIGSK